MYRSKIEINNTYIQNEYEQRRKLYGRLNIYIIFIYPHRRKRIPI